MRLYTIQSIDALKVLVEKGLLVGEERYVEPIFLQYFQWMMEQANARGIEMRDYPIWACPDKEMLFRIFSNQNFKNRDQVLITFEVPDEQCLLSSYHHWEEVLIGCYIYKDAEEAHYYETTIDWYNDEYLGSEQYPYPVPVEKSWERIFSIENYPDHSIQAVTPKITASMVKNIEVLSWNPFYDTYYDRYRNE